MWTLSEQVHLPTRFAANVEPGADHGEKRGQRLAAQTQTQTRVMCSSNPSTSTITATPARPQTNVHQGALCPTGSKVPRGCRSGPMVEASHDVSVRAQRVARVVDRDNRGASAGVEEVRL